MRKRFRLTTAQVRDNAIAALRCAPLGYEVVVQEPKRTLAQNDAFWPRVREIAKSRPFAGKMRSEEEWKTILLSGWMKATGRRVEVVEGIEGEPVALGISSSGLGKAAMTEALDWIEAWAAQSEAERAA